MMKLFLVALVFLLEFNSISGRVWRVIDIRDGLGTVDGTSWGNGASWVSMDTSVVAGDSIWVKAYEYGTINLSYDSITFLGGFAGTEVSPDERDPSVNTSNINLSGTVTNGYIDGMFGVFTLGNNNTVVNSYYLGIYAEGSNISIKNSSLVEIHFKSTYETLVDSCEIYGFTVYNYCRANINNSTVGLADAGYLYNWGELVLKNSIMEKGIQFDLNVKLYLENVRCDSSYIIYHDGSGSDTYKIVFNNVIQYGASGTSGIVLTGSGGASVVEIYNSLLLDNAVNGVSFNGKTGDKLIIKNSILLNNGMGNIDTYQISVSQLNNITDDLYYNGLFLDAANNDYHLTKSSTLALDKGTSIDTPSFDIENNVRPYDGGLYDIGPYEYQGRNEAPLSEDISVTVKEDSVVTISLVVSDTDEYVSDYKIVGQPTNGIVSLLNGVVTYTPDENYNGVDSFLYLGIDNYGLSGNASEVTIDVLAVNDSPESESLLNVEVLLNQSTTIDLSLISSDVDIEELSYVVVDSASNGTIELSSTGEVIYTPFSDYEGLDSFSYKVVDVSGLESEVSTVSISVVTEEIVSVLNLVEQNKDVLKIYPNPAKDVITVESSIDGEILIMNLQEKVVGKVINNRSNVERLKRGIYFVVLKQDGKTKAVKSFYKR